MFALHYVIWQSWRRRAAGCGRFWAPATRIIAAGTRKGGSIRGLGSGPRTRGRYTVAVGPGGGGGSLATALSVGPSRRFESPASRTSPVHRTSFRFRLLPSDYNFGRRGQGAVSVRVVGPSRRSAEVPQRGGVVRPVHRTSVRFRLLCCRSDYNFQDCFRKDAAPAPCLQNRLGILKCTYILAFWLD